MTRRIVVPNERGIALPTVMLLSFAVATVAFTGAMWILNAQLIQKSGARASILNDVAVAAVEEGRSRIAADPSRYPDSGFVTLENNVDVTDANNVVIPGLKRSVYAGPNGITSGQYGVFGTVISVVTDSFGNRAVRRLQVQQESFAKYAYFTTIEGNIVFANNDQIRGPVHSNDLIKIDPSGAIFFDQVTTAQSSIQGESNGDFRGPPPRKRVTPIVLPTVQAFTSLQKRAQNAKMSFVSTSNGGEGEASLRLDFVALDLNGDGDSTDTDEGFVRIYQNSLTAYVTAQPPSTSLTASRNCGAPIKASPFQVAPGTPGTGWNTQYIFRFADTITGTTSGVSNKTHALSSTNSRCYLGGDPRLYQTTWPDTAKDPNAWDRVKGNATTSGTGNGWIPRTAGIGAPTVGAFTSRPDAAYLWPINRDYNPAWEGVIYVNNKVAISGVVGGRVTVATPANVIIADDIRMAIDPGSATASACDNILGLFSGNDILVANNTLNAPQSFNSAWRTYDNTTEEDIHAVLLALDIFGAQDYDEGATSAQPCGTEPTGRGCLAITGGIIQRTRGAVGLTDGHGYTKRYTYNSCAVTRPPPYFPTTGRFSKNRIFELDPRGFDVNAWFKAQQNN